VSKAVKAEQALVPTRAELAQNAILGGLSPSMISEVMETGKLIMLETPQQIYEAGHPIREVYFPIDAVLSVVTQTRRGLDRGRNGRARRSVGNPAATRRNDIG
jgi:hypothetical protein